MSINEYFQIINFDIKLTEEYHIKLILIKNSLDLFDELKINKGNCIEPDVETTFSNNLSYKLLLSCFSHQLAFHNHNQDSSHQELHMPIHPSTQSLAFSSESQCQYLMSTMKPWDVSDGWRRVIVPTNGSKV